MSVTMTPRENEPCHFVIEGEMTIYTALELKEQLRRAVDNENFELAAELRDRIRVLE